MSCISIAYRSITANDMNFLKEFKFKFNLLAALYNNRNRFYAGYF